MNTELHFKSGRQDWETPQELFDELDREFHFTMDCCASSSNTKVPGNYFTEEDDALTKEWRGVVWMNPPYGAAAKKWVRYAYEQAQAGNCAVVCLLAARTDTAMFHDYCAKGEVRFLRGRLTFQGAPAPAPFPSMVVIFRPPIPRSKYVTMHAS